MKNIDDPKLQQSLVFYADILGFSDMVTEQIMKGDGEQCLDKLLKSLNKARVSIQKSNLQINGENDFQVKFFTDNIILGFPIENFDFTKAEPEFGNLLQIISEYQMNLAMDGYFIRGGLSIGMNYMDENIVFGDALINAHKADRKNCPPRITLSPKLISVVKEQFGFYLNEDFAPQYIHLLKDSDGELFVNYLNEAFDAFPEDGIFIGVLDKHKIEIEKNLHRFENKPKIRIKYEWAARYHNFICWEIAGKYPIQINSDEDDMEYVIATEEAQEVLNYLISTSEGLYPSRIDPLSL